MTELDDGADVGPCPGCKKPVRRMKIPIAGSGLDLVFPTRAWCDDCLQRKVVDACREAGLEPGEPPRS